MEKPTKTKRTLGKKSGTVLGTTARARRTQTARGRTQVEHRLIQPLPTGERDRRFSPAKAFKRVTVIYSKKNIFTLTQYKYAYSYIH